VGEWYYIGHYGQLGPLTTDQIEELIDSEVISRETYIWKTGMSDWQKAGDVIELVATFRTPSFATTPPPAPASKTAPPPAPVIQPNLKGGEIRISNAGPLPVYSSVRSDKSRVLAGILQIIFPGVGRMYLGYSAYGVLQLIFALCGVGFIWSFIDGVIILAGGVRLDGYGRQLGE